MRNPTKRPAPRVLASVLLFAAAAVLVACGGMSRPTSPPIPVEQQAPEPSFVAYPGPTWFDQDGARLPVGVISVIQLPEHCGWQSAAMLHLGWPLGTNARTSDDARQYIRDPEGVLSTQLMGDFERATDMPDDAELTYHTAELDLYISPSDVDRYVYVAYRGTVERWPRAEEVIACA